MRLTMLCAILLWFASACTPEGNADTPAPFAEQHDAYAEQRARMVERQIRARGVKAPHVLAAMRAVPRHEFVPVAYRRDAYADAPLPIGKGQTISQPYIVAFMTEQLKLSGKRTETCLEVGAGSGYQAAVLSLVCRQVYTVEIVPALAELARATLKRLGYDNVQVRAGDGYRGWPARAPFAAIVVTAAADHIPPPLIEQLAPNGRLVMPVGTTFAQELLVVAKTKDRAVTRRTIPVRFVPLTGEVERRSAK